jgi:hypothetical protein
MVKIENYDDLIFNLNELLECAHDQARLDGPMDVATLEFAIAWFEENHADVEEWFKGMPVHDPVDENEILSSCCDAPLTYLDNGDGNWVLCCRGCKEEVYFDGEAKGD